MQDDILEDLTPNMVLSKDSVKMAASHVGDAASQVFFGLPWQAPPKASFGDLLADVDSEGWT